MTEIRDVFISYHTNSAKPLVENIANKLESKNISCWFAPRDCEDCFDDAIIEALGKAKIFLLVLNSFSSNSEQVKNEIKKAFDRYSKKEMAIIIFQIDNEPVSDTVDYFLGRIHRVNGIIPPIENRIDELVNRVEYVKTQNNLFECSSESRFVSTFISSNTNFVGRQKELKGIEDALNKYQHISISGMGGIGKSELIKEYIFRNKNKFRSVMWGTFSNSLFDFVISDNNIEISNFFRNPPEENDESYYRRKIDFIKKNATEEDLLVIDNFNVGSDIRLQELLSLPISIIFSSRFNQCENNIYDIKLEPMEDKDELLELFKTGYPRLINDVDKEYIYQIFDYVKGHTLSILIIAKMMRDKRINPMKMLEILKNNQVDNNQISISINDVIGSIFMVSDIDDEEKRILSMMVFVPYEGIEAERFYELANLDSYEYIDLLINKNWLLHNSSTDFISLHPLVAHMINKNIGTKDEYVGDFIKSLIEKMNNAKYLDYEEKKFFYPIIERTLRYINPKSIYYVDVFLSAFKFFHATARHLLIVKYGEKFLENDLPDYAKASAQTFIADVYRCINNPPKLLEEVTKANELFKEVKEKEKHMDIYIQIISRFGWYHTFTSNYDEALKCFNEQLDLQLKYYPNDYENIGWSYFTVAETYRNLKKYDKAIELFNEAISYFFKIGMEFAIANGLKALAKAYFECERYDECRNSLETALAMLIDNVGEIHNDVAFVKKDLAALYRKLNIESELANQYELDANKVLNELGYNL